MKWIKENTKILAQTSRENENTEVRNIRTLKRQS